MSKLNPKTQAPKMTGAPGFKENFHTDTWLKKISDKIKAGVPDAVKRLVVLYHGGVPHMQPSDLAAPIEARPSSEISDPVDLPNVADLQRKLDGDPPPIHPAMLKQTTRR